MKSSYSPNQVKSAIIQGIASLSPAITDIDSDIIIPIVRGQGSYVPDYGIPAEQSENAAIGMDIRSIGEGNNLIEKKYSYRKKVSTGDYTTVTKYKIKDRSLDNDNIEN